MTILEIKAILALSAAGFTAEEIAQVFAKKNLPVQGIPWESVAYPPFEPLFGPKGYVPGQSSPRLPGNATLKTPQEQPQWTNGFVKMAER